MIIVEVENTKDGLEKAIRKYKKKHEKIKITKQIRNRMVFTKKSIRRRTEILKAKYISTKLRELND